MFVSMPNVGISLYFKNIFCVHNIACTYYKTHHSQYYSSDKK